MSVQRRRGRAWRAPACLPDGAPLLLACTGEWCSHTPLWRPRRACRWVQEQASGHSTELWSDGVEDYLTHAKKLLKDFGDVLANGGSSEAAAAAAPAAGGPQQGSLTFGGAALLLCGPAGLKRTY